jgi:hypothetical protein
MTTAAPSSTATAAVAEELVAFCKNGNFIGGDREPLLAGHRQRQIDGNRAMPREAKKCDAIRGRTNGGQTTTRSTAQSSRGHSLGRTSSPSITTST